MARRALSSWGLRCLSTALALGLAAAAHGVALDERGEISFGVRSYTAARIGTQGTDVQICYGSPGTPRYRCGGSNGIGPNPTVNQSKRA
jgi:hypothetical protein